MNRFILSTLLIFVLILTSCFRHEKQTEIVQRFKYNESPSAAGFSAERMNLVDSMLNRLVHDGILPNAVTFVARHGKVIHHKAYGWKNIEQKIPVKPNDIFRIASQSKAITSAALMILYEEGRFLLDDPVSKYIPEFKDAVVMESFNEKDTSFTTRPAKGYITIRHLLTHTSGIHYGILDEGSGNMMYSKAGIPAVNSLDPITIEQVVKKIARQPLMCDPGEKFLYGMNLDVAGYLVEVLSGKPLDIFMKERIFDPLGMNDSYFYLPDDKADRLVTLYRSSPEGLENNTNESYQNFPVAGAKTVFLGGAGLCGPIEDYAKFCQMILNKGTFNGHRILGRKTVDIMTCNQIGEKNVYGPGSKFGLGFEIAEAQSAARHLGSVGALKWGGMYATDFLIDPVEDMVILIYTNTQPYSGPEFSALLNILVYQALEDMDL